jgi:Patatin-like phospholipase
VVDPLPTRECDFVMKGGITSGVIYAGAIVELARGFRFKRIGGTSAGAIGAAVAAAAEYARERDRRPEMTHRFQQLIEDLTTKDFFPRLLQPFRAGRPVLGIGLSLLRQNRRPVVRIVAALWRVVRARWWWALLVAAGAAASVWGVLGLELPTWWTVGLVALIVAVAVALAVLVPALLLAFANWRGLADPDNRFGLCTGISTGGRPALTDWLHSTIQHIAGLPETEPLTFRQLGAGSSWP